MTAIEWNAAHEVGATVDVTLDDGSIWRTTTRSRAWEIGGGVSVVSLSGKAGGYLLQRVRAVFPRPADVAAPKTANPQCCARMFGTRCAASAEWHVLAEGESPEMHVDACGEHLAEMLGDARTSIVSRYVDGELAR